jgi:regulator of sigma E protease
MGAGAVGERTYALLTLPVEVARGAIAPSDARLVGFKGMYDIYQEVQEIETGPSIPASINLLAFFAMISTSLGILNLLPIPALDGGRILFTLPSYYLAGAYLTGLKMPSTRSVLCCSWHCCST